MKFHENLTKYRKRAGLTQNQLAMKLSVTPQAVSKWENGSYPDSQLLPEISKILDVSLDVLFGLKEEEGSKSIAHSAGIKIQQLPEEKRAEFVMKLFYNIVSSYNLNTIPEEVNFPESLVKETYASLRTDYEIAMARLNPDMQYVSFIRIPENGVNSYFKIEPRLIELFSFLSDENVLEVISYAETLGRNCILTKDCIAKDLNMSIEVVSEIVDRLDRFGIMWELTANTGEGSFPIYGYVHNVPLVTIFVLAESLVNFLSVREPDIDIWTKPPFRKPEENHDN
ncbi:MAG TPA: transcriptional regulator [Ruminococcus sp.]|nr:transcriptional regulator [Ruminococcus sp.]